MGAGTISVKEVPISSLLRHGAVGYVVMELSPCDELLQANLKMAMFAFPCACTTLLQSCSLIAESFQGSWELWKESAPF